MKRLKYFLAAGLAVAAIFVIYRFDPAQAVYFPKCPFHELTGLYCPGCGSTRALHQLLHCSIKEALSMNPLMLIMLPVLGLLWLQKNWIYKPAAAWAALVILVLYGVLRNINLWPFNLLAPH